MNRQLAPVVVGAAVALAGCTGSGDMAVDGTGEPGPRSTPDPHPTAAPWPSFELDDYTYTLRVGCFCVDRGVPVVVTVRDGKATDAVYAHQGWGHAAGEPAEDWMRVTINDVIDAANSKSAYRVRVSWPKGQAYPTAVWVDRDANAADEEVGYSIHHVIPIRAVPGRL